MSKTPALQFTDAELYNTVHDEITMEVATQQAHTATLALQDAMAPDFLDVLPEAADVVTTPDTKTGAY